MSGQPTRVERAAVGLMVVGIAAGQWRLGAVIIASAGLTLAAMTGPNRNWKRRPTLHSAWTVAVASLSLGMWSLQQSLVLPIGLTIAILLAVLALPHELSASAARRATAAVRLLAHTSIIMFLYRADSWRIAAVFAVGFAAALSWNDRRELSRRGRAIAPLWAAATSMALAAAAVRFLAPRGATPAIVGAWGAAALGATALVFGYRGLRSAELADSHRSWLLNMRAPCAEIDGDGTVIDVNEMWQAEFGRRSLADQLGGLNWTIVLAAFVEARLGNTSVHRELSVARGPARSDIFSLDLEPNGQDQSTCLLTVRVDRDRPDRAEVDQLQRQAVTDPLTGSLNRRGMELELQARLARTDTYVVYADLDGFKAVNDSLGHQAGDEVLVEVTRRLRRSWRDSDAIARVGGDEFVILTHTQVSAERMSECTDALTFNYHGHTISASLGLAHGVAGSSPTVLLDQADRAMYDIKKRRKAARLSPPRTVTPATNGSAPATPAPAPAPKQLDAPVSYAPRRPRGLPPDTPEIPDAGELAAMLRERAARAEMLRHDAPLDSSQR